MADYTGQPASTLSITALSDETGSPADIASAHLKVTDSSDSTFIVQTDDATPDCYATFSMTADMVNPETIDTMTVTVRAQLVGTWSDDTLQLNTQAYSQGGVTPLSDNVYVCDASTMTTDAIVDFVVPLTGLVTDAQQWANNEFWLHWNYGKSRGPDGINIRVLQVDIAGTYTAGSQVPHDLGATQIQQRGAHQYDAITPEYNLATTGIQQSGENQQIAAGVYDRVSQVVEIVSDVTEHTLTGGDIAQQGYHQPLPIHAESNLATTGIQQAGEHEQGAIGAESNLLIHHVRQQSAIQSGAAGTVYNLQTTGIQQQGGNQQKPVAGEGSLTGGDTQQQSAIESGAIGQIVDLVGSDIAQQGEHQPGIAQIVMPLSTTGIQQAGEHQQVSINQYERVSQQIDIVSSGQENNLTTQPLAAQARIQQGTITREFNLAGGDIQAIPEIEQAEVTPDYNLTTKGIQALPQVQRGVISGEGVLTAEDIQQQGEIEQGALHVEHNIGTTGIQQQGEIEEGTITGEGSLGSWNVAQQSAIESKAIATEYNLATTGIQQRNGIEEKPIHAESELTGGAISAEPEIQQARLVFAHDLATTGIQQQGENQPSTIVGEGELLAANIQQQSGITQVRLDIPHNLAKTDLSAQSEIEQGRLTTQHKLVVADIATNTEIQSGAILFDVIEVIVPVIRTALFLQIAKVDDEAVFRSVAVSAAFRPIDDVRSIRDVTTDREMRFVPEEAA